MTDLDKARGWAERMSEIEDLRPGPRAAVRVIQSLPDHIIDAKKLREFIEEWRTDCPAGDGPQILDQLESLLAPPLPTLADMTQEEREACKWMQCRAKGFSEDERLVIAHVDDNWVTLWREAGDTIRTNLGAVTPLPDLPKLEWPGNAPQEPYLFGGTSGESDLPDMSVSERMERTENSIKPEDVPAGEEWIVLWRGSRSIGVRYADSEYAPWRVKRVDGVDYYNASDSEITLVEALDTENVDEPETTDSNSTDIPKQPSDVPPNEPWLIEANGWKAIGTRYKGDAVLPWFVAALDGSFADDYHDSVVTLIHKLVPEPPALPEGMRLADHEEYGRVVVSPETDQEDDYLAFYSDKNIESGSSWAYPKEYELTFLGGEA